MKKKIILAVLSLMLIGGIAGTFWGPSIARAASSIWNSCPRGIVNDPYPGLCRDYIDTNKDGICDRSQPAPKTTPTTTTPAVASPAATTVNTAETGVSAALSGQDDAIGGVAGSADPGNGRSYYVVPLLAGIIILYSITWTLSAKKVIKTLVHRKIWNVVLLLAALVSAVLGIILTLNIDYHTRISLPFNMLFWHVEAGIALGVVAFFHILWHWRYFTKMLKPAGQAT